MPGPAPYPLEAPWGADITYISTWTGSLYQAVVVDASSRRVVGWSMATHRRTELVLGALRMAVRQRRPAGATHYSDQGGQYTSIGFGNRGREAGVRPSMESVGDGYDNVLCRSFFATLECSCSIVVPTARKERRVGRWSNSHRPGVPLGSKAGTTRIDDTHLSTMRRRRDLKWSTRMPHEIHSSRRQSTKTDQLQGARRARSSASASSALRGWP